MFAVIRSNGKQYKVQQGDIVDIELLDPVPSKTATFSDVLVCGEGTNVKIGKPTVAGAKVEAEVLGEVKADKVVAFKFRRRKGYHRTVGHRQRYLRLKVNTIKV